MMLPIEAPKCAVAVNPKAVELLWKAIGSPFALASSHIFFVSCKPPANKISGCKILFRTPFCENVNSAFIEEQAEIARVALS